MAKKAKSKSTKPAPLPIHIYDGDRLVEVRHLDDPRIIYVEEFNKRNSVIGRVAVIPAG